MREVAALEPSFPRHVKVTPLSDAAFRLHVTAICWCKENSPTGYIPSGALTDLCVSIKTRKKPAELANELVGANAHGLKDAGLWEKIDGGYIVHDLPKYPGVVAPLPRAFEPASPPAQPRTKPTPRQPRPDRSAVNRANAIARWHANANANANADDANANGCDSHDANDANQDANANANDANGDANSHNSHSHPPTPPSTTTRSKKSVEVAAKDLKERGREACEIASDDHAIRILNANARRSGERPRAAKMILPTAVSPQHLDIPNAFETYANELGLTPKQYESACADWRAKTKPSTVDHLADKLCRFIEAAAEGRSRKAAEEPDAASGKQRINGLEDRTDEAARLRREAFGE